MSNLLSSFLRRNPVSHDLSVLRPDLLPAFILSDLRLAHLLEAHFVGILVKNRIVLVCPSEQFQLSIASSVGLVTRSSPQLSSVFPSHYSSSIIHKSIALTCVPPTVALLACFPGPTLVS